MNIRAIVEIPKNSTYKYEINKETGRLVLDRILNQEVPENYGFLVNTLSADNDPLDIFIISEYPIQPLSEVEVSIICGFRCTDNGISDDKLIAVIKGEKDFSFTKVDIHRYLTTYKKGFKVIDFVGESEAVDIYLESKI